MIYIGDNYEKGAWLPNTSLTKMSQIKTEIQFENDSSS